MAVNTGSEPMPLPVFVFVLKATHQNTIYVFVFLSNNIKIALVKFPSDQPQLYGMHTYFVQLYLIQRENYRNKIFLKLQHMIQKTHASYMLSDYLWLD